MYWYRYRNLGTVQVMYTCSFYQYTGINLLKKETWDSCYFNVMVDTCLRCSAEAVFDPRLSDCQERNVSFGYFKGKILVNVLLHVYCENFARSLHKSLLKSWGLFNYRAIHILILWILPAWGDFFFELVIRVDNWTGIYVLRQGSLSSLSSRQQQGIKSDQIDTVTNWPGVCCHGEGTETIF